MADTADVKELIQSAPFELSASDKATLLMREQDFAPHTWDDIKQVIGMPLNPMSLTQLLILMLLTEQRTEICPCLSVAPRISGTTLYGHGTLGPPTARSCIMSCASDCIGDPRWMAGCHAPIRFHSRMQPTTGSFAMTGHMEPPRISPTWWCG